jgi:hypothetical protein
MARIRDFSRIGKIYWALRHTIRLLTGYELPCDHLIRNRSAPRVDCLNRLSLSEDDELQVLSTANKMLFARIV